MKVPGLMTSSFAAKDVMVIGGNETHLAFHVGGVAARKKATES